MKNRFAKSEMTLNNEPIISLEITCGDDEEDCFFVAEFRTRSGTIVETREPRETFRECFDDVLDMFGIEHP